MSIHAKSQSLPTKVIQAYNQHLLVVNEETNHEAREDIFVAYRPKIVAIARRLYSKLSNSSSIEIDDLVSGWRNGVA